MSVLLQPVVLNERTKTSELIAKLDSIPLSRMYQASFKAAVRLHVYFTGRTHELFLEFGDQMQALILKMAGKDQVLDGATGFAVQSELMKLWGDTFEMWRKELEAVRVEAASIPFGVLAVAHERLVIPAISSQQSAVSEGLDTWRDQAKASAPLLDQRSLNENVEDGVFGPQLRRLLQAAEQWMYGCLLYTSPSPRDA